MKFLCSYAAINYRYMHEIFCTHSLTWLYSSLCFCFCFMGEREREREKINVSRKNLNLRQFISTALVYILWKEAIKVILQEVTIDAINLFLPHSLFFIVITFIFNYLIFFLYRLLINSSWRENWITWKAALWSRSNIISVLLERCSFGLSLFTFRTYFKH